ncbi:MoxR family ATPase [Candidatus Woesearchaeota archaeon]|nr:MoxR family ATPase [Candidatus Woesearchaeota archaeon]
MKEKIKAYQKDILRVKEEISKIIVGQEEVVNALIRAVLADGHVLVEGIPGIAKTLLVKTLSNVMGGQFSRIQFTVDLLPTDIVGITSYTGDKGFYTVKGPIFANFLLADEINRAPPKTQSALLEAMQEKQATIGKRTYGLPLPFFVMATQNPIESEGVYPLPKAQIDRFLFKALMGYPSLEQEKTILKQNISLKRFEEFKVKSVITMKRVAEIQQFIHKIYLNEDVERYIVNLVDATRHPHDYKIGLGRYIEWGGSPRASIGLFIASKTQALLCGKEYVTPQFVKDVAHDVLRHRILVTYEGRAEGVTTDDIISEMLSKIPVP